MAARTLYRPHLAFANCPILPIANARADPHDDTASFQDALFCIIVFNEIKFSYFIYNSFDVSPYFCSTMQP